MRQPWQRRLTTWLRWRPFNRIMRLGIQLVVPKHRVGVSVVALDEQRRVYLLNHVFHPYVPWGLPGGWLKRHEAPQAGLKRELREETGLSVEVGPVLCVQQEGDPVHIGIVFLGRLGPETEILSLEIASSGWFGPDDLPSQLLPFSRQAIETAWQRHSRM